MKKYNNLNFNNICMSTLLIVDDDKSQCLTLAQFLKKTLTVEVENAASGQEALIRLADGSKPDINLVLLDYFMPDMDGRETLHYIHARHPEIPVIMLTANEELEDAVTLLRAGASDYLTKPFNPDRLRLSVEQHLTIRTLQHEVARLKRSNKGQGNFADLIGAESGLKNTVALARKAATSEIPVLISGESGTGKELLARAIHGEGTRSGKAFVAINCGAIPENLVESTLFGHEKGAFTGATTREIGKFREAEGGTLLLDEIGELKPDMQTRLLRALQSREIEPVGTSKPIVINVRIIAATHRRLSQDVITGRFREDLYYRLNVLPITIPPLRDRKIDIPLLTQDTVTRFCVSERKPSIKISETALEWLSEQRWAGNVRELENLLYRAVVISDKRELGASDFIAMTQNENEKNNMHKDNSIHLLDETGRMRSWDEIEAHVIAWALKRSGGHVSQAATMLGMGQSTLYKKLAEPRLIENAYSGSN